MTSSTPKVFGIGLSKTGTTSLAHALEILGYRTKDYPGITRYQPGDVSSVDAGTVDAFDALTDTPIPSFYRELDEAYPGSKFILTVRDRERWLNSCRKQFTEKLAARQNDAHNRLFMELYGCTAFDERKFVEGYERFVGGVLEYFQDRRGDLLVINVAGGEGWEVLCPFLGKAIPGAPFPKANVTNITWLKLEDIVAVARRAGHLTLRAYERRRRSGPIGAMLNALRGGDTVALQRASRAADRVISDGLRSLNAQIPIISRESNAVPHEVRARWNHFWLVDSLDGADAFLGQDGEFSINIALVQDGIPLYGVVYAPKSDLVYSARVGDRALKAERGEVPRPLGGPDSAGPARVAETRCDTHASPPGSRALAVCHVAEGASPACGWSNPTHEWQVAAAHLIAANAGRRVHGGTSTQPIRYNKARQADDCVIAE